MTDHLSKEKRSWNMSRIRGKNTTPELKVRSLLHSLGYRFRLHRKDLPGSPDIVLPKYKTVIFVNGCFWHHHKDCKRANWPKTNTDYWKKKIRQTVQRDKESILKLKKTNWYPLIIWECDIMQNNNELYKTLKDIKCKRN